MAKTPSLNPFRILAEAWAFWLKQPALTHVLVWLLILPMVAFDLLNTYWPQSDAQSIQDIGQLGFGLVVVLSVFAALWGGACVLLVGRRMVVNRAGRSRTAFAPVRREALPLILPILFTSILRTAATFVLLLLYIVPVGVFLLGNRECQEAVPQMAAALSRWGSEGIAIPPEPFEAFSNNCGLVFLFLPLLLPAVIYQIKTIFYPVTIAVDDLRWRQALVQSRRVTAGRFWKTLGSLVVLCIILFSIPGFIIGLALTFIPESATASTVVPAIIISDAIIAAATLLFTLSLIALYAKLRKGNKDGPVQVVPD